MRLSDRKQSTCERPGASKKVCGHCQAFGWRIAWLAFPSFAQQGRVHSRIARFDLPPSRWIRTCMASSRRLGNCSQRSSRLIESALWPRGADACLADSSAGPEHSGYAEERSNRIRCTRKRRWRWGTNAPMRASISRSLCSRCIGTPCDIFLFLDRYRSSRSRDQVDAFRNLAEPNPYGNALS